MNTPRGIRIGVLADTHGVFDPAIERHFDGVSRIVHAGDIGSRLVIDQLERIAPVTAVSGNVDVYEESGFPTEAIINLNGFHIAVRHVVFEAGKLTKQGRAFLHRTRPDICIFGHTHQSRNEWLDGTLLFNPGSAGPKRFKLQRSLGFLTISEDKVDAYHVALGDRAGKSHFFSPHSASSTKESTRGCDERGTEPALKLRGRKC
jgi:uncharacterized protein